MLTVLGTPRTLRVELGDVVGGWEVKEIKYDQVVLVHDREKVALSLARTQR